MTAHFVKTKPFTLEAYNEAHKLSGQFPKLITTNGDRVYQLKVFNLKDGNDLIVGLLGEEYVRTWDANGQSDRSNGYPLKIIVEEFDGSEFVATND